MKKLLVLPAIALSLIGTGTAAASVPETNMNKTPEVTEIQLGNGDDSIIMYSSSILLGSQTVSFDHGSGSGYFWNKSGDDLKFWIQNTGPSTLRYKLINSAGHTLYQESISPGAQKLFTLVLVGQIGYQVENIPSLHILMMAVLVHLNLQQGHFQKGFKITKYIYLIIYKYI